MRYFVRAIIKDVCEDKFLILNEQREQSGIWNFPGGKIEPFENSSAACIREIYEETSLTICDFKFLFQESFYEAGEKWVGYYFWINKVEGKLNAGEEKCNDYNYITLSDILKSDNKYISSAGSYIERIVHG